jgi:hypothetical protein
MGFVTTVRKGQDPGVHNVMDSSDTTGSESGFGKLVISLGINK